MLFLRNSHGKQGTADLDEHLLQLSVCSGFCPFPRVSMILFFIYLFTQRWLNDSQWRKFWAVWRWCWLCFPTGHISPNPYWNAWDEPSIRPTLDPQVGYRLWAWKYLVCRAYSIPGVFCLGLWMHTLIRKCTNNITQNNRAPAFCWISNCINIQPAAVVCIH